MSVEKKKIKGDNFEIEYAKFGSGDKPFVIIPGLSIKSVLDMAEAVETAYSCFEEEYTVYLFDRRAKVEKRYKIADMADDISFALKELGIENAALFGTSQGGTIALVIALKYPELAGSLVLGSSASRLCDYTKNLILKWIDLAENGETEMLSRDFVDKLYSPDFAEKYGDAVVKYNSSCTKEELERFIVLASAFDGYDVYDKLNQIKCPVLVLGAENDRVLTAEMSYEMAEKLKTEIYMYPLPYGHAVYDEAPDYKKRILDFLKH